MILLKGFVTQHRVLRNQLIRLASLVAQVSELFDGVVIITGREIGGAELTFIPYHLWGNRGPSQMSVFVRV